MAHAVISTVYSKLVIMKVAMFVFPSFLALLLTAVPTVYACNGYELKDHKINVCENKNDVVDLDNFSIQINDKCEVVTSGSIIIKKQINGGNASYSVEKEMAFGSPMTFGGEKDICEALEESKDSPDLNDMFKTLNIKQHCPVEQGKLSGEGKRISMEKKKNFLFMLEGCYKNRFRGNTDAGDICLNSSFCVARKAASNGGLFG